MTNGLTLENYLKLSAAEFNQRMFFLTSPSFHP